MPDELFLSLKCHILMQLLADNKLPCNILLPFLIFTISFLHFGAKHSLLWCFRTARPWDHLSVKPETWRLYIPCDRKKKEKAISVFRTADVSLLASQCCWWQQFLPSCHTSSRTPKLIRYSFSFGAERNKPPWRSLDTCQTWLSRNFS